MKLYKEPLIVGVSITVGILIGIFSFFNMSGKNQEKTVDNQTPIPVLEGDQTITQLKQTPGIGMPNVDTPTRSVIQKPPKLDLRSTADKYQKKKKLKKPSFGAQLKIDQLNRQNLIR